MCQYIKVVAPEATADAVGLRAAAHGLAWHRFDNPHLLRQLEVGEAPFLTTQKHCDCDSSIGLLDEAPSPPPTYERELARLRRKGWGEAKVARWLDDKRLSDSRRAAARPTTHADIDNWLSFLAGALESAETKQIGLLVHLYRGALDTEKLHLGPRRRLPLSELTADTLLRLPDDIVLAIRR